MIHAQVALYTRKKITLPPSLRRNLMLNLQSYIQIYKFSSGSNLDRLVTSDLEISLSELGCCEIFGDMDQFLDLIPRIIKKANSLGLEYYWLFLDTQENTSVTVESKEELIKDLKLKEGLSRIHFCGVRK